MNLNRVNILKNGLIESGTILYWMSRDQRVNDNWALIYAYQKSKELNSNLIVCFTLADNFLNANLRHYSFMLSGLKDVEKKLKDLNIPFYMLVGDPSAELEKFIVNSNIKLIVTDFDPLRIKRKWKEEISEKIEISFHEVDAHNIVPCWLASPKQEVGAYTFRPKINKFLPEFLDEYILLEPLQQSLALVNNNFEEILNELKIDRDVASVEWIKPGEENALNMLDDFLSNKAEQYEESRNNPVAEAQSNISPYLHYGTLSSQRIVLNIQKLGLEEKLKSFIEELIVRKELSDNYCYYNINYDNFNGFPNWAKETLNHHKNDEREFVYNLYEFENGKTHEDLWNASQNELLKSGKIHGYMRMYWAKKILEWSESPEDAQRIAIYLNDKYELDGRDPNGYTGIAWSIGGVHDRAWFDRPITGKIRYMNRNGCKRKFDIKEYIDKWSG